MKVSGQLYVLFLPSSPYVLVDQGQVKVKIRYEALGFKWMDKESNKTQGLLAQCNKKASGSSKKKNHHHVGSK